VDPNNKADVIKATIAIFLLFKIIRISEH